MFDLFEGDGKGEGGSEHVEHARTGIFNVFDLEGMGRERTCRTCPPRHV